MTARDFMAPAFRLFVEGHEVGEEVTQHVVEIDVEHTVDVISKTSIVVQDADNRWTDSILWEPGNEVDVFMGYGNALGHVGRFEILRHLPDYPEDGVPTLKISGYDRAYRMTRQSVDVTGAKRAPKKKDKLAEAGRVWANTSIGEVVSFVCAKYGITPDIDPEIATKQIGTFVQKKGTSDYKILRYLANIYGAEFFVEFVPEFAAIEGVSFGAIKAKGAGVAPSSSAPGWVCRFRLPKNAKQEKTYEFERGTPTATILSASVDWGIDSSVVDVQVSVFDRAKGEFVVVNAEAPEPKGKPKRFSPGLFAQGGTLGEVKTDATTADAIESPSAIKIAAQGHSIDVPTRSFKNAEEAIAFAQTWLERHRDAFLVARATLPGVETLRGGQTHRLKGLGRRYDGDFYFAAVRHRYDSNTYRTEVIARKVVEV